MISSKKSNSMLINDKKSSSFINGINNSNIL